MGTERTIRIRCRLRALAKVHLQCAQRSGIRLLVRARVRATSSARASTVPHLACRAPVEGTFQEGARARAGAKASHRLDVATACIGNEAGAPLRLRMQQGHTSRAMREI